MHQWSAGEEIDQAAGEHVSGGDFEAEMGALGGDIVSACADVAADEGGDGGGEAEAGHEADHEEAEHVIVGRQCAGAELGDDEGEEEGPSEDVGDHLEA